MTARLRAIEMADRAAHILHCPTLAGRRSGVAHWHHRIHLIPGWLLASVCDRYDLMLGVTRTELHRARPARCRGWACEHAVVSSSVPLDAPRCGHGCTMRPWYAPSSTAACS